MKALYYQNSHLDKVKSKLIKIDGNYLNFEESIFYPEGGGQPGDIGSVDGVKVISTDKKGILIEDSSKFVIGKEYEENLDYKFRYHYMVEHTAQHLLSAILFHEKGLHTVSVHLGEKIITIELEEKEVDKSILLEVEELANQMILKGKEVYAEVMTYKEAEELNMRRSIKVNSDSVRVVFLKDYDEVGCGGVHVDNINEIKEVSFISSESIRGHLRTTWKVGEEAVKERKLNKSVISQLNKLFSSPTEDLIQTVNKEREKIKELENESKDLKKILAKFILKDFIASNDNSNIIYSPISVNSYIGLIEHTSIQEVLILDKSGKNEFLFYGTKSGFEKLKNTYNIKGGGKEPYFRGQIIK